VCAKRERSWSSFARLWVCWPTRTSDPLWGVYVTSDQFGIWFIVAHVHIMRYYGEFSPTLIVKGGIDQHIRLLESIIPSPDYSFYAKRGRKRKWPSYHPQINLLTQSEDESESFYAKRG
jgi:hypothetical protein